MFTKNKECTNQIIIRFLDKFNQEIIKSLNLADNDLSNDQINEIFYNKHYILLKQQIQSIDCSKLNALNIRILFTYHLKDISQNNVNTFSNIALQKLTLPNLATLLKQNSNLDFYRHKNWLKSLYLDDLFSQFKNKKKPFVHFVAKHIEFFSQDQILSLRKYVFEEFNHDKPGLENEAKKVLDRLSKIEKEGTDLEKNLLKITGIKDTTDNTYSVQALAMLVHIYQKSPDELKKLLSYLIKNNELFAWYVERVFFSILNQNSDQRIKKYFSNYQQMYKTIMAEDKDKKYTQLDTTGFKDCISQITAEFKTILKTDKDPKDASKGKNINYLCLPKLGWIISHINALQDLSDLLSDEQIQSIDIGNVNVWHDDLYLMLDKFGNKIKYGQFYQLVSNFNNKQIELLSNDKIPDKNHDDLGSRYLVKIASISNFINEKEKEFQEKYSEIGNLFDDNKLEFYSIISELSVEIYPQDNAKQMEYFKNNPHNRALYEKCDNTENVNNNLKVNKNDKEILNELKNLSDKLQKEMKELKEQVAKIKKLDKMIVEIDRSGKKKVEIEELRQKLMEIEGLNETVAKIKDLNKPTVSIKELDEIVAEIKKSDEYKKNISSIIDDFEQKREAIKQKVEQFDRLYYERKNKFSKLKTNFLSALGNLDTGKVSICLRNMHSNYKKNYSDSNGLANSLKDISNNNKELWKLNPIVIKAGDKKKKLTFKEFFMDGFIKIQSEKKQDGTQSNFSSQQKRSMGIINVVNKIEEKNEKGGVDEKVEEYTPEHVLNNLPLILEQFHCTYDQLENEMKNVGLFDLTLKFDKNKKSLERFIDSEKFIDAETTNLDDNEQRTREEINEEHHRYFQAVKKLFCVKADNIVENADLVFETDINNKLLIPSSQFIQREFNSKLKSLTQKEENDVTNCLDKKAIIENLTKMKIVPREHFLFFCGYWICCSKKFCSKDNFLTDFKKVVKKRIEFACRGQGINKLQLNDDTYNLLTAVTLLFGLQAADQLYNMDKTVIDEICFLITGKKEDFSLDDAKLIMSVTTVVCKSNFVAESIVKNIIKNQDCKCAIIFIFAFDLKFALLHDNKIEFIDCIGNRDKEIDFMSVISDINEFGLYPYYGTDKQYATGSCNLKKLSFSFMKKLMEQLLEKYQPGIYPNDDQKAILGKFLEKFIVGNNEFKKNEQGVSKFFTELMKKVPPEKSKEVTKEIIKICSKLREKNQRAAILKDVLDASNNSLKGLELLEVLEQYDYVRGFMCYDEHGFEKGIDLIEFDSDLIDKLISDIIEKPSPLTKKEVQRLERFCTNCYRKDERKKNDQQNKSKNEDEDEDHDKHKHDKHKDIQLANIQRQEAKLFYSLMIKMPEGSMSIDMFKNLVAHFFPSLASNMTHENNSKAIKEVRLNLNLFDSSDKYEYLYENQFPKDTIRKRNLVDILAYVLPQGELKHIMRLESLAIDYREDDDNYGDCCIGNKKYCFSNDPKTPSYYLYMDDIDASDCIACQLDNNATDQYQKSCKDSFKRPKEAAAAEKKQKKKKRKKNNYGSQ